MLLGGHGEEEREYHPTRMGVGLLCKGGCMCMFVCDRRCKDLRELTVQKEQELCVCHVPWICTAYLQV